MRDLEVCLVEASAVGCFVTEECTSSRSDLATARVPGAAAGLLSALG